MSLNQSALTRLARLHEALAESLLITWILLCSRSCMCYKSAGAQEVSRNPIRLVLQPVRPEIQETIVQRLHLIGSWSSLLVRLAERRGLEHDDHERDQAGDQRGQHAGH